MIKTKQSINLALIDDEEEFLSLTEAFLRRFNSKYKIKKFQSSKEFLNNVQNDGIDIIISDYEIDEMNGLKILLELKKRNIKKPFIMVSGKAREEIVIEAAQDPDR